MRLLAAVALLTGSLVGCVGDFATEHIEARYHRCLDSFKPLAGVNAVAWDTDCASARAFDYDYRLSLRRLAPCNYVSCGRGGSYQAPTQVIIMN